MIAPTPSPAPVANPLLHLTYEPALQSLGDDYYDVVAAASFPQHQLRFRNDDLLHQLGLDPAAVTDADFVEAFGLFCDRTPFLALRYHGYQFGEYNPRLGDGRGFLYGQVRDRHGDLYDLGTKGSGTTPYSRGGDGRLTLKGGVREVLAAEMLHVLGVRTSRCLSLIETGESLWRGDEPSPTRASVMVRFSRSHIRFGTFERLHYLNRADLAQRLLDHVIACYYSPLLQVPTEERYARFFTELVQRTAELAAQWMSAGFCHAVLNTDNMSITGESFDYGPYAFIDRYNLNFTAAYFDYYGRYCYGHQPGICRLNLEMLQTALKPIIPKQATEAGLAEFDDHYYATYRQRMVNRLGFAELPLDMANVLVAQTVRLLQEGAVGYHEFFMALRQQFSPQWQQQGVSLTLPALTASEQAIALFDQWRSLYYQTLLLFAASDMESVQRRLQHHNPTVALLRPEIEAIWEPIVEADNWQPFYDLLGRIKTSVEPVVEPV